MACTPPQGAKPSLSRRVLALALFAAVATSGAAADRLSHSELQRHAGAGRLLKQVPAGQEPLRPVPADNPPVPQNTQLAAVQPPRPAAAGPAVLPRLFTLPTDAASGANFARLVGRAFGAEIPEPPATAPSVAPAAAEATPAAATVQAPAAAPPAAQAAMSEAVMAPMTAPMAPAPMVSDAAAPAPGAAAESDMMMSPMTAPMAESAPTSAPTMAATENSPMMAPAMAPASTEMVSAPAPAVVEPTMMAPAPSPGSMPVVLESQADQGSAQPAPQQQQTATQPEAFAAMTPAEAPAPAMREMAPMAPAMAPADNMAMPMPMPMPMAPIAAAVETAVQPPMLAPIVAPIVAAAAPIIAPIVAAVAPAAAPVAVVMAAASPAPAPAAIILPALPAVLQTQPAAPAITSTATDAAPTVTQQGPTLGETTATLAQGFAETIAARVPEAGPLVAAVEAITAAAPITQNADGSASLPRLSGPRGLPPSSALPEGPTYDELTANPPGPHMPEPPQPDYIAPPNPPYPGTVTYMADGSEQTGPPSLRIPASQIRQFNSFLQTPAGAPIAALAGLDTSKLNARTTVKAPAPATASKEVASGPVVDPTVLRVPRQADVSAFFQDLPRQVGEQAAKTLLPFVPSLTSVAQTAGRVLLEIPGTPGNPGKLPVPPEGVSAEDRPPMPPYPVAQPEPPALPEAARPPQPAQPAFPPAEASAEPPQPSFNLADLVAPESRPPQPDMPTLPQPPALSPRTEMILARGVNSFLQKAVTPIVGSVASSIKQQQGRRLAEAPMPPTLLQSVQMAAASPQAAAIELPSLAQLKEFGAAAADALPAGPDGTKPVAALLAKGDAPAMAPFPMLPAAGPMPGGPKLQALSPKAAHYLDVGVASFLQKVNMYAPQVETALLQGRKLQQGPPQGAAQGGPNQDGPSFSVRPDVSLDPTSDTAQITGGNIKAFGNNFAVPDLSSFNLPAKPLVNILRLIRDPTVMALDGKAPFPAPTDPSPYAQAPTSAMAASTDAFGSYALEATAKEFVKQFGSVLKQQGRKLAEGNQGSPKAQSMAKQAPAPAPFVPRGLPALQAQPNLGLPEMPAIQLPENPAELLAPIPVPRPDFESFLVQPPGAPPTPGSLIPYSLLPPVGRHLAQLEQPKPVAIPDQQTVSTAHIDPKTNKAELLAFPDKDTPRGVQPFVQFYPKVIVDEDKKTVVLNGGNVNLPGNVVLPLPVFNQAVPATGLLAGFLQTDSRAINLAAKGPSGQPVWQGQAIPAEAAPTPVQQPLLTQDFATVLDKAVELAGATGKGPAGRRLRESVAAQ